MTQTALRDRVGLVVAGNTAPEAIDTIVAAEDAGVTQVWMTQGPVIDSLSIFAAAASRTKSVRLGTSIVPFYPRHPLVMAQQAITINDIAPGRLRLGIGPSHRPIIEGVYGLDLTAPMAYQREYVEVLRAALWEGNIDHHGRFFNVTFTEPRTTQVPILISALREGAFRLAGEVSDGAISWICPVPYLLKTGLPALKAGAESKQRTAPPLVAHVIIALNNDRSLGIEKGRQMLNYYKVLPFYANMFADAGFPVTDGNISDGLVDSLVITGNEAAITARIQELLSSGLDELIVTQLAVTDEADEQKRLMRLIGQL
ncbi:MAG TPA: LLM class flavin-dependent oxidoreductase [Dictyobacter sp.]|jgi:F420-dependent oxidoreductase-like protein|nr:LLM class flavin-dependent oxidoreductase [Dictyobacter sp.]